MCVCVRALPVPRQSWLGFVVGVSGFEFRLSAHQSSLRVGVCELVCALRLYLRFPVAVVPSPTPGFLGPGFTGRLRRARRGRPRTVAHRACCWPLLRQGC